MQGIIKSQITIATTVEAYENKCHMKQGSCYSSGSAVSTLRCSFCTLKASAYSSCKTFRSKLFNRELHCRSVNTTEAGNSFPLFTVSGLVSNVDKGNNGTNNLLFEKLTGSACQ